jgi:uncharacterized protein (TIGR04141 family)
VRDPLKDSALNDELINQLNGGNFNKVWMAVPDAINWADLKGFRYGMRKKGDLHDDLNIGDFVATLQNQPVTTDLLKGQQVFMISAASDDVSERWSAYRCTYAEVLLNGKLHILNNGKWYAIADGFSQQVLADYTATTPSTIVLPDCTVNDEEDYNETAAGVVAGGCCMDQNFIMHGGGHNKLEFCDIYTTSKKLVHVKRYGGSSVLSHLFAQGIVSAELFAGDDSFRQKLNAALPATHRLANPVERPNLPEFEIVYAIISNNAAPLDIPFFSKVSLKNARRRLRNYGYQVALNKIQKV